MMHKTLMIIGFIFIVIVVAAAYFLSSPSPQHTASVPEKNNASVAAPTSVEVQAAAPQQNDAQLKAEVERRFEKLAAREKEMGGEIVHGEPLVVVLQPISPAQSPQK